MGPYLVRPLFVLGTVFLLLVAFCQIGGRIAFAHLDRFEPYLNERLADRGIELHGLEGGWRFLNPVVEVASGVVPGAEFGRAKVEFDVLESLSRNRLILRYARFSDLRATLVQNDQGAWALAGRRAMGELIDWPMLGWHSDQLEVTGALRVKAFDAPVSELNLRAELSNFGGRHRGIASVGVVGACDGCSVIARYSVEESLLWVRERNGGAVLSSNNFSLRDSAAELLGLARLEIPKLDTRWRLQGSRFFGALALDTALVQIGEGEPLTLSVHTNGWVEDDASASELSVDEIALSVAGSRTVLRRGLVNYDQETGGHFWLPHLLADAATLEIGKVFPAGSKGRVWVERLGITAEFRDLHAYWGAGQPLHYRASFRRMHANNYEGIPGFDNLAGNLQGYGGLLRLGLAGRDMQIQAANLLNNPIDYLSVDGDVWMHFAPNHFALKARNLSLASERSVATGGVSVYSTEPGSENHIITAVDLRAATIDDLKPYIPLTLPANTLAWLDDSQLQASVDQPRLVLHGPLREDLSTMRRSYVLSTEVANAALRFHADWPRISNADGQFTLSHLGSHAHFDVAACAAMAMSDLSVYLPPGAANIEADGRVALDGATALELIRTTPLRDSIDFLADDWSAAGPMLLDVELAVPLRDTTSEGDGGPQPDSQTAATRTSPDPDINVALRAEMQGVSFDMPEVGLEFTDMVGRLTYLYPYDVNSSAIGAHLFGRDVTLTFSNTVRDDLPAAGKFAHRSIDIAAVGSIHTDDMWPLIGMDTQEFALGVMPFNATYTSVTAPELPPTLELNSPLTGVEVVLPTPLGKAPNLAVATRVQVQLLEDAQRFQLTYGRLLDSDLLVSESELQGGQVTLGGAPVTKARDFHSLRINGELEATVVEEWLAGDSELDLPNYRLDDIYISKVFMGDLEIPDTRISGRENAELFELEFNAPLAAGSIVSRGDEAPKLALARYEYVTPANETAAQAAADPLLPEQLLALDDLDVDIDRLLVDGEDYGRWSFELRKSATGVRLNKLKAQMRGLAIATLDGEGNSGSNSEDDVDESDAGLVWSAAENRTSVVAEISANDMSEVLGAWGYGPSLESESMRVMADLSWPGSPLNYSLVNVDGQFEALVKDGRFNDVAGGSNALRIFSLLNFTAIVKRLNFNFSDVFGRGLSFDEVSINAALRHGELEFVEPLHVQGTGGEFRVNGVIDLVEGELDNELVVTLPVNKSLPWLGAYLALANPIAGLGVLIGERIFRRPLEGLSSARYGITGTLDAPEVNLVSVFDDRMKRRADEPDVEVEADEDAITVVAVVPGATDAEAPVAVGVASSELEGALEAASQAVYEAALASATERAESAPNSEVSSEPTKPQTEGPN